MKVLKDKTNNALAKFPDNEAKQLVEGNPTQYTYSTRGALKSRFNSVKKQRRANLRLYFKRRIELKVKNR